jgi:hypothetical protein
MNKVHVVEADQAIRSASEHVLRDIGASPLLASRSEFEPNTGNAAAYLKNIVGSLNSGDLRDIGDQPLR